MPPEILTLLASGFFALLGAWCGLSEYREKTGRLRRLRALRAARQSTT